MATSPYKAGKHFLQIPGPSNVPDRILRAWTIPQLIIAGRILPKSAQLVSQV